MEQYIQKEDIQTKVELKDIGGIDWYDFPHIASEKPDFEVLEVSEQLMNDSFWVWKTAVLLRNNDLDCLYRPDLESSYLIAEFSLEDEVKTIVKLGNIDWRNISDSSPVGFYQLNEEQVIEIDEGDRGGKQ